MTSGCLGQAAPVKAGVSSSALYRRGALARATMMSGALEKAMDLAVTYAQERHSSGGRSRNSRRCNKTSRCSPARPQPRSPRPISGSRLCRRRPGTREVSDCGSQARVGEAATLACEIAHQVHGAIGFTKEYTLQLSTRRLWSWREEFGGDPEWAAKVGAYACRRGADALWPTLTDG